MTKSCRSGRQLSQWNNTYESGNHSTNAWHSGNHEGVISGLEAWKNSLILQTQNSKHECIQLFEQIFRCYSAVYSYQIEKILKSLKTVRG